MGFPYESTKFNTVMNVLPFVILGALFISAVVAQFACHGGIGGMLASLNPRMDAPRLIGS